MERIRKRLSRIETLPDEAVPVLQWAFDRIDAGRASLRAVQARMNERLAAIGVPPVSYSAVARYAERVRRREVRRPADAVGLSIAAVPAGSAVELVSTIAMTLLSTSEGMKEAALRLLEANAAMRSVAPETSSDAASGAKVEGRI